MTVPGSRSNSLITESRDNANIPAMVSTVKCCSMSATATGLWSTEGSPSRVAALGSLRGTGRQFPSAPPSPLPEWRRLPLSSSLSKWCLASFSFLLYSSGTRWRFPGPCAFPCADGLGDTATRCQGALRRLQLGAPPVSTGPERRDLGHRDVRRGLHPGCLRGGQQALLEHCPGLLRGHLRNHPPPTCVNGGSHLLCYVLHRSVPHLRVPISEVWRLMPPNWFLRFWTDQ